jgi:hypothetical protein
MSKDSDTELNIMMNHVENTNTVYEYDSEY